MNHREALLTFQTNEITYLEETRMKEHREHVKRPARRLLASLCIMMQLMWMNGTAAFGQTSDMPDLYRTKGKVIAEGKNTAPTGHYKVVSYRIEEVSLP